MDDRAAMAYSDVNDPNRTNRSRLEMSALG